jgi:hypothetical protein
MVKYVPDRTGRFSQRPHYPPKELDRECENIIAGFLKERHGAAFLPSAHASATLPMTRLTPHALAPCRNRLALRTISSRTFRLSSHFSTSLV